MRYRNEASLTLEVINDFRALVEIEREWSSFTRTIEGVTPFQLPEWLLTWWRHFGSGQLHVLVFRHAGEVAGIVHCYVHDWDGRRQMTLIGSGVSDYLEPAIAKEHCCAIVDQLQAHLKQNSSWDICNWQDLCFETPLKRLASKTVDDIGCCVIAMAGEFEEYWQARPKNLRRNVRRDRQKAESRGALEFQVCAEANRESMQALIQLHTARWHHRQRFTAARIGHVSADDEIKAAGGTTSATEERRTSAARTAGRSVSPASW